MHLIPTILCGGAGSRLWPVSRELHPKPFIRLADGQSLLQKAFLRGAALPGVAEVLTVTNRELYFKAEGEFGEVNAKKLATSFILEPFGRNTAAAIAAATLYVAQKHGQDAILLVLAADHLILDQSAFAAAVTNATELAQTGKLVTFGIQPDSPETGFGYIEADKSAATISKSMNETNAGFRVLRFVEKPTVQKAQEYLDSGRFYWNSGMFCFSAGCMLREMDRHCPEILDATRDCLNKSRRVETDGCAQVELNNEYFDRVPDDSIDYAVLEKAALPSADGGKSSVVVVPCIIGWSDIGSWTALSDLGESDGNGNRVEGDVFLHNTKNCYIQSGQRVVGAVGVENLIVIDTPDALLIANKASVQDVKHIYNELKSQAHNVYKLHRTVYRPWGTYTVLEEGPRFKIKRIVVKPGARLSLQMHHHRNEHWVVVSGMAKVLNGDNEVYVNINESTYIPAGHRHRLENPGVVDLIMIEVQSGEYLGEDDIVRFEDSYGRATNQ